ncbi:hypothetical protein [Kitasatospora sp. NPDC088134]|uniref:hypothetical protein n=1 Tax=Kitasatospora sp. NPDC088134 TaxID=3364071 RepID=UPI003804E935
MSPAPAASPASPTPPASPSPSPAGLLPAALAPWAPHLSALTPALASALGPLVRGVDALIAERESRTATDGEPDGWGGLARRGRPDRLRPAEWLLAQELPEEFVRRHQDGELLYLAPEFRKPGRTGRVVVLVETGPRAAGAARLVQLAALVALRRRAAARGTELVLHVLGDPPAEVLTGDLPELLPQWLAARRAADPDAAAVAGALAALAAPDEAWLLTTPELAAQLPDRLPDRLPAQLPGQRRTLTAEPVGWGAGGATGVRIVLRGSVSELPLPESGLTVRALRGAEFARAPGQAVTAAEVFRLPVFNSVASTLLARGAKPGQLAATRLRPDAPGSPDRGRARVHGLGLPVLAAAQYPRRLIVLVHHGGKLLVKVVGRPLTPAEWVPVDALRLGLDRAELAAMEAGPILPLLRGDGSVTVPLTGRWWTLTADGGVSSDGPLAPRNTALNSARFRWAHEPRLYGNGLPPEAAGAPHRVFAPDAVAWSQDGEHWLAAHRTGGTVELTVPAGHEPIGLVGRSGELALVTCSTAGLLVRSVRPGNSRTLSSLSGGRSAPVVHPSLPLIVAEPEAGRVVVGDAFTGKIHTRIGVAP